MPDSRKKAFITGITGQDGSYLAECLLSKGYEVHGLIRRASTFNTARIDHLYADPHSPGTRLRLHYGDLSNSEQISDVIYNIEPDEVYNLGAQSHVRVSFDIPEYTGDVTALGTLRILEAIRRSRKEIKFYQASSSETFGDSPPPQSERTPFRPRNPYAIAKLYAYSTTANYREAYGIFACNGILFNHESPRRGETFVTRKVTRGIARIAGKKDRFLYLGNLSSVRDWGYAPEYVEAMWRILQTRRPDDYVLGTGQGHSVQELVDEAFEYAKMPSEKYVRLDKRYLRPIETDVLIADSRKAKKTISWKPRVGFADLVRIMVDADFRRESLSCIGIGDQAIDRIFPGRWWKVE